MKKKAKKKAAKKTTKAKAPGKSGGIKKTNLIASADHFVRIDVDENGAGTVDTPLVHNVKGKQKVQWIAPSAVFQHRIQVSFNDPIVKPQQFLVPGAAKVIDNPAAGTHFYDVIVDGNPAPVTRGAPGIIIE